MNATPIHRDSASLPGWWPAILPLTRPLFLDSDGAVRAGAFTARPDPLPSASDDSFADDDPRVERLQRHIYATAYAAIAPGSGSGPSWRPKDGMLQTGPWRVLETLRGGAVVARRGQIVRRLEPGEYVYDGVPVPVRRAALVTRHRARCSTQLDAGFVYVFGAAEADAFGEDGLVRYYLNVRPSRLRKVVRHLIRTLDACALPFFFKYPDSIPALVRRDALVLYAGARYAAALHWAFAHLVLPGLAGALMPQTPLWARRLAPGLAFAQEPDSGESFGTSRSRALARALVAAAAAPQQPLLAHVRRAFSEEAIDWAHPHLNADARDRFGLRTLAFGNPAQASGR